ncbi:MAG: APC family permease [archaeon]|jgi:APA family basic amino acid/polyamine antiporter
MLERSISLRQAIVYGVGVILGAGIYALIGQAAAIAGNLVWLAFIVAAIIALLTAFSYAELSARFPKESAEAVYAQKAFGKKWFAFFIGFVSLIVMLLSASAVALGFASYFKYFFPLPSLLVAILVIIICSIINFFGIQESVKLNNIFTFIEALGLILIIVFGLQFVGSVNLFEGPSGLNIFESIAPLFSSIALIFFAYLGFEQIANISEEIVNPKKNVPLAIVLSLIIATIIYILVAIVAVSVVTPTQLGLASGGGISEGPLALVATNSIGPGFGFWLSIIALFATGNTILILLIVSSRILYGLSEQKLLPKCLSICHKKTKTPYVAIAVSAGIGILFLFFGNLEQLGNLTTLGTFLLFFVVNVALIALRLKEKKIVSKVKSPFNIGYIPLLAVVGALFCGFMFFTQYWQTINILGFELPMFVFGVIVFALAFPIHWAFDLYISKRKK